MIPHDDSFPVQKREEGVVRLSSLRDDGARF